MGRVFAGNSEFFVDEFDFSGVVNAIDINTTNPMGDITSFTDTDFTFVEGKPSFTIDLAGLYSTSSPDYDGEMFADLTSSDRLLSVSPAIAAANGGVVYFGQGDITSMPIISTVTDAVVLNVTWNGNKPLTRGLIAHRATALATTTNGTGRNLGALSATQQLIAFQHVLSSGGDSSQTLDTVIQSDSDDNWNTPTPQITFPQVTTSATSARGTKSGVVSDSWWRANMTIGGSGSPTFSVLIVFGIANLRG